MWSTAVSAFRRSRNLTFFLPVPRSKQTDSFELKKNDVFEKSAMIPFSFARSPACCFLGTGEKTSEESIAIQSSRTWSYFVSHKPLALYGGNSNVNGMTAVGTGKRCRFPLPRINPGSTLCGNDELGGEARVNLCWLGGMRGQQINWPRSPRQA